MPKVTKKDRLLVLMERVDVAERNYHRLLRLASYHHHLLQNLVVRDTTDFPEATVDPTPDTRDIHGVARHLILISCMEARFPNNNPEALFSNKIGTDLWDGLA